MMPLSNKYTSTSINPILTFIQDLSRVGNDRDNGIKVIQKRRELFWPLTEAASDDMTQLSSLQFRDGWPITHVLFRATLQWSIISVSDSVSQSLTGFSDPFGLTAWVDCLGLSIRFTAPGRQHLRRSYILSRIHCIRNTLVRRCNTVRIHS